MMLSVKSYSEIYPWDLIALMVPKTFSIWQEPVHDLVSLLVTSMLSSTSTRCSKGNLTASSARALASYPYTSNTVAGSAYKFGDRIGCSPQFNFRDLVSIPSRLTVW